MYFRPSFHDLYFVSTTPQSPGPDRSFSLVERHNRTRKYRARFRHPTAAAAAGQVLEGIPQTSCKPLQSPKSLLSPKPLLFLLLFNTFLPTKPVRFPQHNVHRLQLLCQPLCPCRKGRRGFPGELNVLKGCSIIKHLSRA